MCINSFTQDCSSEWGGAYIVLFFSAIFWCTITIGYVLTHSQWVTDRRRAWGIERLNLLAGSTWHLDVWRFIVQREIRSAPERPPDAHIWDPSERAARMAQADAAAERTSERTQTRRKRLALTRLNFQGKSRHASHGRELGSSAEPTRQLSSTALMYSTPLSRTYRLLSSQLTPPVATL